MKPSTCRLAAVAAVLWSLSVWSSAALAQQATTLSYGSAASVGMDAALLDEAVQLYRDAVERDELKGAVLMVARRGVIVLHEAVGWRQIALRPGAVNEARRLKPEIPLEAPDGTRIEDEIEFEAPSSEG